MHKRIDDVLRLFRVQPRAQVPFILDDALAGPFDPSAEYFSFQYKAHTIVSRFACVETYLLDCGRIELLDAFKELFRPDSRVSAERKRLLAQVALMSNGDPYFPNLDTTLHNLRQDLQQFHYKLEEQLGTIQFAERFRLPDVCVEESRDSVFAYQGQFQFGTEWSILNAWEHRYFVVSGDNWASVTCQRW